MFTLLKGANRKGAHLLPPLLAGLVLIFTYPPFEQAYLAWVALLPLLHTCLRVDPRKAFWAGFVFGLPLHLYLNLYLTEVLFPFLSPLPATAALAGIVFIGSFWHGAFGYTASQANRRGVAWFTAMAVPAAWLAFEYVRSLTFLAYNIGYLGYSQWNFPPALSIASVYGYWGLPFFIVSLQVLVLLAARRKLRGKALYAATAGYTALLAAGLIIPGFYRVEAGPGVLRTALVQGNIGTEEALTLDRDEVLEHYLALTGQAIAKDPEIRLVAWPETVGTVITENGVVHHPSLVSAAGKMEADLLYGARAVDGGLLYNAVAHISRNGEDTPLYYKHRLVPFVEFFPMEGLLNRLIDIDLLLGSYNPGTSITLFAVDDARVAAVICFESYFGDHTRQFARRGASHLFVPTNDAWFGRSIGLDMHAQVGAIRAAEAGTGVTQVANSGITISFDNRGREMFRSGKEEETVLVADLSLDRRSTLYARLGDYFPACWIALTLLCATISPLRRFKAGNP